MKIRNNRRQNVIRPITLVGVLIIVAAAMVGPIYSVRSSSVRRAMAPTVGLETNRTSSSTVSSSGSHKSGSFAFQPFLLAPPAPETVVTFASDCTTPKTDFDLGETVCAQISGAPLGSPDRAAARIGWVSPYGSLAQGADITTDPQNGTYLIPTTPTQTFTDSGGSVVVVDNRGTWRISTFSTADGSLRSSAFFTVHDPATPNADLSVNQTTSNSQVTAGSSSSFSIFVSNKGPDTAQNVVLTDVVPNDSTFAALAQTSGSTFTCTAPAVGGTGTITCTIASLPRGASASFDLAYAVNGTATVGTVITNTASASSDTAELAPDDNSFSDTATVIATGTGTGTCSVACPDDITTPANTVDGSNNPGAIVHFSPPSGNTECGPIVVDHCNDCFFPVGTTIVTGTGAGDSCSFAVTITPAGSAPTISCPSNQTANADNDCSANVSVGTATATGTNVTVVGFRSDGKPLYTCDAFGNCTRNGSDAPYSAGTTTITWFAYSHDVAGPYTGPTDANGDPVNPSDTEEGHRTGSATCTQTVVVNDVTPPVIAAVNSSASADASCQAAVPDYSGSVSDNCACSNSDASNNCEGHPRFTYTQTPAAGTLVGLGPHTVHIEANDGSSNNGGAGNTATKDVTFTVNDTTAPAITCPANIVRSNDPGTCSAVVNPGTPTATDNCDSTPTIAGTRSDNQALNAPYPKGTTIITWSATDDAGNTSSCQQSVTVNDTENPVITCPAPIVRGNDPDTCSATVDPGSPTATDNCGSPTVTGTRSDGQPLSSPYPKGTTTITWTATDGSGNHSSCTQTVTVIDVQAPSIHISTQSFSMWPPNHKYQSFQVSNFVTGVTDNCDGSIAVSSVHITKITSDEIENGNGDGNTTQDIVIAADCKSFQLRSEREGGGDGRVYTIYFSVADAAGNVGTATARVVVPHNPGETPVDSGPHYTVTSNCP